VFTVKFSFVLLLVKILTQHLMLVYFILYFRLIFTFLIENLKFWCV